MEELIDRIYEAAALPEFWPAVLDELTAAGSGFATIMSTSGPNPEVGVAENDGRIASFSGNCPST
jgi:hypothetical protein